MERKLTAILAADVVGYSRLMGEDEVGTLARLKADRAEVIDPKVIQYGGRTIKLMGDGVLMEFSSVVEAVAFAVDVQSAIRVRNADLPEQHKILYRIGINIGDVIVEGDDIYGDGVNVAVRLETLSEVGGVCIAGSVRDQIRDKLDLNLEDLGKVEVKNIARPVPAFKVTMDEKAVALSTPIALGKGSRMRSSRALVAATIAFLLLTVGTGLWFRFSNYDFAPATAAKMAHTLPDKPSIAVLPFEPLSDDKELRYFATGLTEGLTSALARIPRMFIVSSVSAATYKGKPVNIKQVAEEQGVHYVLRGSVQKTGERLRIIAILANALVGRNIWTDRFDLPIDDVFAVQDKIVKRVTVELQVEFAEGSHARSEARGTKSLKAWLLNIRAKEEYFRFNRDGLAKARELREAARRADPNWARPIGGLALVDWYEARKGWSASREDAIRRGVQLAKYAIQMDPNEPLGYMALGNFLLLNGEIERAMEVRHQALAVAPNDYAILAGNAVGLKNIPGREQEALRLIERAIRLCPKHPWWVSYSHGIILHQLGRKEEAVDALKRAIGTKNVNPRPRAALAAVYADLGRMKEAKATADDLMRLSPKFNVRQFMKLVFDSVRDPQRDIRYKNLLLKAGFPE